MNSCLVSTNIFHEAYEHCRHKKKLVDSLKKINILDYKNKTFEEIIIEIYSIFEGVKHVGPLTKYDITSAICRYYNINIDKVYIIGGGPNKSIKLLNIKTQIHKINNKIKLKFVEINDVLKAFDTNQYELDETIRNTKNGDKVETYLCNWQKTK